MRRDDIVNLLRAEASRIKSYGVTSLYLFGSTVRNEAGPDSDVDVFVDYDSERFGLIEMVGLKRHLSEVLGRPADLGTRDGLHPLLREEVEAEALRVF